MELKDKVAFITGGASGLGRATAENFIAAGARVMVFDLNEENAQKAAEELGDNATWAAGDVADEDAVKAAVQLQLRLNDYNEERAQKGRLPIKIGVGFIVFIIVEVHARAE